MEIVHGQKYCQLETFTFVVCDLNGSGVGLPDPSCLPRHSTRLNLIFYLSIIFLHQPQIPWTRYYSSIFQSLYLATELPQSFEVQNSKGTVSTGFLLIFILIFETLFLPGSGQPSACIYSVKPCRNVVYFKRSLLILSN